MLGNQRVSTSITGNKSENNGIVGNQRDVLQQHIRIETEGVVKMSDEKVISANDND